MGGIAFDPSKCFRLIDQLLIELFAPGFFLQGLCPVHWGLSIEDYLHLSGLLFNIAKIHRCAFCPILADHPVTFLA
jgi:hypothetical protein